MIDLRSWHYGSVARYIDSIDSINTKVGIVMIYVDCRCGL